MDTIISPQKKTSIWPYAIIVTYVLFAGYIGYMVKQAMSTSVDLVSKDYYQKELEYQQHMNTVSRTSSLAEAVTITHNKPAQQLTISLPQEFAGKDITGKVHFFRPSDLQLDFEVPLQVNAGLQQHLSTQKLQPGYWRAFLSFNVDGKPYYAEQNITVAK